MELPAATKPTNANFVRVIRKHVQWIKVVPNDSIGTCSSELYSSNLLKLPPPPRAAILVYVICVTCVIWYVLVMIFYHFMDCKHGRDVNMKFRMRSRVESRTSCLFFLFIYSSGCSVVGNPNQTMGPWRGSLSWRWAWKTKTSLKKLIAMRYTWLHTSPHFTLSE